MIKILGNILLGIGDCGNDKMNVLEFQFLGSLQRSRDKGMYQIGFLVVSDRNLV